MTYNHYDLSKLLTVERVENPPMPSIDHTVIELPNVSGARFVSKRFAPRVITVKAFVEAKTREALNAAVDEIAMILNSADVGELAGLPASNRRYNASVASWDAEKFRAASSGIIEFICYDPYGYGDTHAEPLNQQIGILGSTYAMGTITQTIPEAMPGDLQFVVAATEMTVRIFGPFSAGDVVVVDLGEGIVRINGQSAMRRVDIQSDWFVLPPGGARINTVPGTLTGGTFEYTERWL